MAGDLDFDKVSLLILGKGNNGSTEIKDSSVSGHAVSVVGNTHISNDQSAFNGASIYFDGAGDYLTFPISAMAFGQDDFTMEVVANPSSLPSSDSWPSSWSSHMILFSQGTPGQGDGTQLILGATKLILGSNDGQLVSGLHGISAGGWHKFSTKRLGDVFSVLVDEVVVGSATIPGITMGGGTGGYVGCETGEGAYFHGFMSPLRVTKFLARNIGTPPLGTYPDYAGQISGNVKDASGANTARLLRAYRRDTGALSGSATSDASTGNYTINCPTVGEHTVIALDDDAGSAYNALVLDRITPI